MKTEKKTFAFVHKSGREVKYSVEIPVYESVQEVVKVLGEVETLNLVNRQIKTDILNRERVKALAREGLLPSRALTPEEKEKRRKDNEALKQLKALAKSKGIPVQELVKQILE